jgi:Right handed beta helix region
MRARMATHRRGTVLIAIAIAAVAVLVPTLALAHVERASYWPNPAPEKVGGVQAGGRVPAARSLYSALNKKGAGSTRVVCQGSVSKAKKGKNPSIGRLVRSLKRARHSGYSIRPTAKKVKVGKKQANRLLNFNRRLLTHCGYHSIQAAVNASHNNDRVVIMPGVYTEPLSRAQPTNDARCASLKETNDKGETGAVSYRYQVACPNDQNLIAVMGRAPNGVPPQPPLIDRHNIPDLGPCIRCNVQMEGSGISPDDVVVDAGNTSAGNGAPANPVKDIGIRADRADGFVLRNMTVRHAKEHGIYVTETDGFLLDRFKTFYNGEYGVLTFVGDHGLMQNCDAAGSGDSGLYPGSSADTGEQTTEAKPRYSQEIRFCDMHHNLAGYSGTDGNAVHVDHNQIYDNSNGFTTDVFTAAGHPGYPQDSDLIEDNTIRSNNFNSYLPPCAVGQRPGPQGPGQGCSDVTPAEPEPVGLGMWIAGGNNNTVRDNLFYDNWRRGVMLFAVPDVFVCSDPNNQIAGCTPGNNATSFRNHFYGNKMGRTPKGKPQPNGVDFWWDQGGLDVDPSNSSNCWYNNTGTNGTAASVTGLPSPSGPPGDNLPSDCNNSPLPGAKNGQVNELLTCSTVPQGDPSCPWFTTPPKP